MRLASYNMQNLFSRPVAFAPGKPEETGPVLEAYQRVSELLLHAVYTEPDKDAIIDGLRALGLARSDESRYAWLRQNHGRLVRRGRGAPTAMTVVAAGRSAWIGWLELKRDSVDEAATRNLARVVHEVNADVMAAIEVEGRIPLAEFSRDLLAAGGGRGYEHVMAIAGNDSRGITVGVMSRGGYPISGMVSHVDDADAAGRIFGRDCAEYSFGTPSGAPLLLLVAHFKSQGYGDPAANNAKRRREAERVAAIYSQRRKEGASQIAVVGDFNDQPGSEPLAALLAGTDLREVSAHPGFDAGAAPAYSGPPLTGTYGDGAGSLEKIDYILLSPALAERLAGAGVCRKGVWTDPEFAAWETYPTVTGPAQAASDHAAIWADLDL